MDHRRDEGRDGGANVCPKDERNHLPQRDYLLSGNRNHERGSHGAGPDRSRGNKSPEKRLERTDKHQLVERFVQPPGEKVGNESSENDDRNEKKSERQGDKEEPAGNASYKEIDYRTENGYQIVSPDSRSRILRTDQIGGDVGGHF